MNLGRTIKKLREQLGLTQGQVAKYARVSRSYISLLESGEIEQPSAEKLAGVARALHVDKEVLFNAVAGHEEPMRERTSMEILKELEARIRRNELQPLMAIPVIEQIVHAGEAGVVALDYVYLPETQAAGKRLAGMYVRGDCMEPTILNGDVAIVALDGSPNLNDVVVFLVNGEEVEIRRLKARTDSHVVLACDNLAYTDLEVEDVKIIGVVIQISRTLKV